MRKSEGQLGAGFGSPKASWELRLGSWDVMFGAPKAVGAEICTKRLLALDFEAPEDSGAPRGDKESTKKLPKRVQTTIYRPTNAVWS